MKTFLDPKESQPTPVKPLPIPEPAVSPNWGMACNLFRFAGVHQAIEKPLRALKKEYDAEVAKLNGLSYEDARAEFAANVQAVLDGKRTHSEFLPTKEQLKERNSLARRVIKARAAAVSQKAEVIAADAYEEALKKMPEFRKQLLDAQAALTPGVQLGKSPAEVVLDKLPAFIRVHIAKLREDTGCMRDPLSLIP